MNNSFIAAISGTTKLIGAVLILVVFAYGCCAFRVSEKKEKNMVRNGVIPRIMRRGFRHPEATIVVGSITTNLLVSLVTASLSFTLVILDKHEIMEYFYHTSTRQWDPAWVQASSEARYMLLMPIVFASLVAIYFTAFWLGQLAGVADEQHRSETKYEIVSKVGFLYPVLRAIFTWIDERRYYEVIVDVEEAAPPVQKSEIRQILDGDSEERHRRGEAYYKELGEIQAYQDQQAYAEAMEQQRLRSIETRKNASQLVSQLEDDEISVYIDLAAAEKLNRLSGARSRRK